MALLKKLNSAYKLKGSTLMETLVATILIVLIFMIASMILNNLFSNTIKNNTQAIDHRLNELQYLQQHEQLLLPYTETYKNWTIIIDNFKENNETLVEFEAINSKTKKTITVIKSEEQ
ncbi:hypothetical protein [Winogradskyella sp.]|uniref:PulJ/GspJ family protein n=1 Tax=Winogradskyella sp. TaxID=1883156 RepID=UPI00261A541E|nr:hypothetical protein [Winogradskyella sp.]